MHLPDSIAGNKESHPLITRSARLQLPGMGHRGFFDLGKHYPY